MSDAPAEIAGFVGLGNIGRPIAANLARAFPGLRAYDTAGTQERLPECTVGAANVGEIAAEASDIFLSLPSKDAVRGVVNEIVAARSGNLRTVVDFSTVGVPAAEECAELLSKIGVAYVDAPVSGGVAGARAARITVMCACDAATFSRVQAKLESVAAKVFHVGQKPGQGQALKLLNNFLSATALAATSEAVSFGVRQGLDMTVMLDVLNASSGQSSATSDKFVAHVATGTYSAGFSNRLMAKDVGLFVEAADEVKMRGPIGSLTNTVWSDFSREMPDVDFTRIYEFIGARLRSSTT